MVWTDCAKRPDDRLWKSTATASASLRCGPDPSTVSCGRLTLALACRPVGSVHAAPRQHTAHGCLLMNRDLEAVGLLFAGSAKVTIHNHIGDVEAALGVRPLTAPTTG
jgi:hypothetical protein